jgi:hypothetical protein
MQPRFTTQTSDARSWIIGKSMTPASPWSIVQVSIHAGRGVGARFMKKKSPDAPFG